MPTLLELTDIHQRLGRLLVAGVDWSPQLVELIEIARDCVSAAILDESNRVGADVSALLRQSTTATHAPSEDPQRRLFDGGDEA